MKISPVCGALKTLLFCSPFKTLTRLNVIHHNGRIEGILCHIVVVPVKKMLTEECVINGILGRGLPRIGVGFQSSDAQAVHVKEITQVHNPHLLRVLTRNIFADGGQCEGSVARRSSFDLDFLKDI